MDWGAASDKGLVRSQNEDNFGYFEADLTSNISLPNISSSFAAIVVADGMGGHQAGEIASSLAVEHFLKFFRENQTILNDENIKELLEKAFQQINRLIYEQSLMKQEYEGMGTTMTAGLLMNHCLYLGHVGDSRAYLCRRDKVIQLTEDHSLVNELVKNGNISVTEASSHPQKNVITRAIGAEANVPVDINVISLEVGDVLLFCTDGLTNMVSDEEIMHVIQRASTLQIAAQNLVDAAVKRGGADNITVVLVRPETGEPVRFCEGGRAER